MFDTLHVAEELRQRHGESALEMAQRTAREHLKGASWTAGAQWLRVVDHLKAGNHAGASLQG
jgi:hypothetical protein